MNNKKTIKTKKMETSVETKPVETSAEIKGEKLVIHKARVIFYNKEDEGFGKSITIDATSPSVLKVIKEFCKDMGKFNKKTKEKEPSAIIKKYEDKEQATFRINDYTKIIAGEFDPNKLAYNSIVSLVVSKFDYDNKFGQGTSNSISIIKIIHLADNQDENLLSDDIVQDDDIKVDEMFASDDEQ